MLLEPLTVLPMTPKPPSPTVLSGYPNTGVLVMLEACPRSSRYRSLFSVK